MASSGTILLIDNDNNQNISNRRALERKNFTVYTAADYHEARRVIQEAKPDIIVMETVLPDGDGFTFCKEIRGHVAQTESVCLIKKLTESAFHQIDKSGQTR